MPARGSSTVSNRMNVADERAAIVESARACRVHRAANRRIAHLHTNGLGWSGFVGLAGLAGLY